MLNVDSLGKGMVIDHIKAGRSMQIYNLLGLDKLDCCVAIIKNVKSTKIGKKDIIKIEGHIDIDLDALGYIDPNITVNVIENGKIIEKKKLTLPETLTNILLCKNPRCITSAEQEIDHVFKLVDRELHTYRCIYCEQEISKKSNLISDCNIQR